jgi:CDP-glycerol glycerophosphotransferase (TagB/SpsB family)
LLGDEAATIGSRIHHFAEAFPYFETPICNKEQGIVDFFNNLDEKYIVLHSEFRMYDEEYSKAGTCDAILLNTETDKLVIID